jgi:hypothetical protein
MSKHAPQALRDEIRRAGYRLVMAEQLRTNRRLFLLAASGGATIALFVQVRALVNASDVQDLAEMIHLRRIDRAILWAYGGQFSSAAYGTLMELAPGRIELCTALPPAVDMTHAPESLTRAVRELSHRSKE